MKTGYVTDSFSTLSGLAAVAYSNVDMFREVQNQIIQNSPTKVFDLQRPSDIFFSGFYSEEEFLNSMLDAIQAEYDSNPEFADYIDEELGADWLEQVSTDLIPTLSYFLEATTQYSQTSFDYVRKTLEAVFPGYSELDELTTSTIESVSKDVPTSDVQLYTAIANNNSLNKISTPPIDSVVVLDNSIELGSDFRGVPYTTGYLSPQSYYSEVAYPGYSGPLETPSTFIDSISDGYVGYSPAFETSLNPSGAESVSDYSSSGDASLFVNTPFSELENIPGLSQADRDLYEISLIGARLNNFLSYDELGSNGDLTPGTTIPIPMNSDQDSGVPSSSRSFSYAF